MAARREIAGILEVLGKLHRGQMLHRDLTPLNVFVCEGPCLKLGDFGIVRQQSDRRGITARTHNALTAPEASVHRELHRALDAGLLEREAVGRTFRYVPATTSPLYEPLRQLLDRTVGVEAELATVLGSLPGVDAAVLHGSYARGTRVRPTSESR